MNVWLHRLNGLNRLYRLYRLNGLLYGGFVGLPLSQDGFFRFGNVDRRTFLQAAHRPAPRTYVEKGDGQAHETHEHEDHADQLNIDTADCEVRRESEDRPDGDQC
ncbi:MAG: hypothetical protein ABIS86_01210 [Streptosporangiaceae bacterium]